MRKLSMGIIVFLFIFTNVYLAFTQPLSLELLVRKYDGPAGRKSGDIVSVKRSPASWGKCEGPPKYVIIKVTDIGLGDFEQYKGRHIRIDEKNPNSETVRSKYRFDLSQLPGHSELSSLVEIQLYQASANLIDRRKE